MSTLGFLKHGFWAGRKSPTCVVWVASAAPKTMPKGGGLRPPTFRNGVWGRRGRPDPKDRRLSDGPKTHVVKTWLPSGRCFLFLIRVLTFLT